MTDSLSHKPVALITGGAQRIGRCIAETLHARGFRVLIHYRRSAQAAEALCGALNRQRPDSARALAADFASLEQTEALAESAQDQFGRVDALINNASEFYPTPVGKMRPEDWDTLMGSNLRAPLFLSQALAPSLAEQQGCIVNMADIYAERPLAKHTIYSSAKAGLVMLTKSLARELAPEVRVNAVAPGAILWPEEEGEFSTTEKAQLQSRVPLQRIGEPADIARTIAFLVCDAPYITGQVIAVDGGRSLSQ